MVIAALQDKGFLRPAYQVAFVIAGDESRASLERTLADDRFFVASELVLFGVLLHLAVGGFFGAVFAFVAPATRFPRHRLVVGVVYALAVMLAMSVVVLPLLALLLDAGTEVSRFGGRIGWGTFVLQHVVYGLMLGWWPWYGPWGEKSRKVKSRAAA
jgi:hypothetical protein